MTADHVVYLQCVLCGTTYSPDQVEYTCPSCGPPGVLEVHYDYHCIAERISKATLEQDRDPTLMRYRALLPIPYSSETIPALAIGGTPLYPVSRLRAHLGMSNLWLKDDSRNPRAS